AGFRIAQEKNGDSAVAETVIAYNAAKHQLYVDRTKAGGKLNEQALIRTIDISGKSNTIKLTVLLDKSSLEVFVNDGEAALTTYIFPGEHADNISAFASDGKAEIKNVIIRDMRP